MRILGIESSCDETGVAIYDSVQGLIAHNLYTQAFHQTYGGVVPELAARDHLAKLLPLVDKTIEMSGGDLGTLDGIAYTRGPGLLGALMVGGMFARSLGLSLNKPVLGVNHLEAHGLMPLMFSDDIKLPFVLLLVSGGHSMLVLVEQLGRYRVLGDTLDDAVGEAFDKAAKMMGMGYPGGPLIEAKARLGQSGRFVFPRPMLNRATLDMSFSGLKTALLTAFNESDKSEKTICDLACGFQEAVVHVLAAKSKRALEETACDTLVVSGGVGANQVLRQTLADIVPGRVCYPPIEYCTDNGVMIAYAGCLRMLRGETDPLNADFQARWPLEQLSEF